MRLRKTLTAIEGEMVACVIWTKNDDIRLDEIEVSVARPTDTELSQAREAFPNDMKRLEDYVQSNSEAYRRSRVGFSAFREEQ